MTNNGATPTQPAQIEQDVVQERVHPFFNNDDIPESLAAAWRDIRSTQETVPGANVTVAIEWLVKAEDALLENPPRLSAAKGHISTARHWLNMAIDCAGWHKWGIAALLLELLYLVTLPVLLFVIILATDLSREDVVNSTFRTVPMFVFVWGFLGGVAWCMYSGSYWTTRRLFDKHYLAWYISHPWMSAVLGAAVSLLVYAGIVGLTNSDASGSTPFHASVSAVSFVAGFSTKYFWKVLDANVRKLFGETGGERSIIEGVSAESPLT